MTDIHDIKPSIDLGRDSRWTVFMILTLAVLVLAAGLTILYLYWKKRRQKVKPVWVPAPDQVALDLLDELARDGRWDGKAFYFRLSGILRTYMQARFSFDAPEMTTEELIPHLERCELELGLKNQVKNFLHSSDPIKFAERPADGVAMQRDLNFIREFVIQTAEKEAQADDLAKP